MSWVDAASHAAWRRIFRAAPLPAGKPLPPPWTGSADTARLVSITATHLRIGPFCISRWGQTFVSAGELRIARQALPPGRYRIVAAHDFRVEDHDADLERARAAVFLARLEHSGWEEPEDPPIECRGLAVLGEIELAAPEPGAGLAAP